MGTRGVVGIFKDTEKLKEAARKIRDAGVKEFDAFTPFPVHGIEEDIGIPRSKLPWVTLLAGLTGCAAGLGLQTWVSASQWTLNVGGKPNFSLPAFIPVAFEITVLFAGLATAGALFAFCGMPNFKPRILDPRITNDRFALFISAEDPRYDEAAFLDVMKKAGAEEARAVE